MDKTVGEAHQLAKKDETNIFPIGLNKLVLEKFYYHAFITYLSIALKVVGGTWK